MTRGIWPASTRAVALGLSGVCILLACGVGREERARNAREAIEPAVLARVLRASPVPPLPVDPTNAVADDPRAAQFGRRLFYDAAASADGKTTCASCHDPALDWTDGRPLARGVGELDVHAPSLWNVAWNRWLFWDGRADSLWAQAAQPSEHPLEKGATRAGLARRVANEPIMRALYTEVFGPLPTLEDADGETLDRVFVNLLKSIAAFERLIVVDDTPFDRYVRGLRHGDADDLDALNKEQLAGMDLFFGRARCHLCHHGPLLTDFEFHDIRLPRDEGAAVEPGRWRGIELVLADPLNGLGEHSDDRGELAREKLLYLEQTPHRVGEFKTPGLRNVARTAPYMHRGHYATLEEVIEHYSTLADASPPSHPDPARLLDPLDLSDVEKHRLEAFLGALSGPATPQFLGPP